MTKSSNLYARIEPDVKENAERILAALGITASGAITMFYKQIIIHGGMPFEIKLPPRPRSIEDFGSEDELYQALEKEYAAVQQGKGKPAEEVFAQLRKEFGYGI